MNVEARRGRVRRIRRVGVLLSLVVVLTVIGVEAPPASAQSIEPVEDPGTEIPPEEVPKDPEVVEVEALLACSNMTTEMEEYVEEHGLCDDTRQLTAEEAAQITPDMLPDGSPAPQDYRWGTCGSSHIYMWNRGGGYAGVGWGFFSILGTVIRRELTVRWANWSRGTGGYYLDSNWMFSNYYSNYRSFYTRSGNVSVWLTGYVRLAWGGTCVILIPTSHGWISGWP